MHMRNSAAGIALALALTAGAQGPASRPKFDAFEVATVTHWWIAGVKAGRMFRMDGTHRWVATNFTLQALIALGYDMNPRTISGGPVMDWMTQAFQY